MIPEIVRFIEELVDTGHAYPVGGDVYFRVASFAGLRAPLGPASGRGGGAGAESAQGGSTRLRALEGQQAGTEDTWWDSPWGRGRPGWHIECSAMSEELLGETFEIHGGGLDLVFPHHENEVAQSRALGHGFAQIWTHNGMLRFVGEKMSKSIGNVVTTRDALDRWGREALLVYFLSGHWRKPIDFSDETVAQAAARLETLRNAFTLEAAEHDESLWSAFEDALEDDFDTPRALAVLHEWAATRRLELLQRGLAVFGLGSLAEREEAPAEVVDLAERRGRAPGAGLRRGRPAARRAERAGWEMRDDPGGRYTLVRLA